MLFRSGHAEYLLVPGHLSQLFRHLLGRAAGNAGIHLVEYQRGNIDHPYLRSGESQKKAIVVLTSNRGLAGGYNANVVKLITESDDVAKENVVIYAVGRKGIEILERKGYHIEVDASEIMENPTYPDAAALCKRVLDDFADRKSVV